MKLELVSPDDTARVGRALGGVLQRGDVVSLLGDLGAGKTLFVQGMMRGVGAPADVRVTSPTFTLVQEYRGGRLPVFHCDLYRIEDSKELVQIGFEDLFAGDAAVCVEWGDKFGTLEQLAPDRVEVTLVVSGEHTRTLSARGCGRVSCERLATWQRALT